MTSQTYIGLKGLRNNKIIELLEFTLNPNANPNPSFTENFEAFFLLLLRSQSVPQRYRIHFVTTLSCVSCEVLSYPPMSSLVPSSVFSQLYSSNWGHTSFLKSSYLNLFSSWAGLRSLFPYLPPSSHVNTLLLSFLLQCFSSPLSPFLSHNRSVPLLLSLSLSLSPPLFPLSLLKRNYCAVLVSG